MNQQVAFHKLSEWEGDDKCKQHTTFPEKQGTTNYTRLGTTHPQHPCPYCDSQPWTYHGHPPMDMSMVAPPTPPQPPKMARFLLTSLQPAHKHAIPHYWSHKLQSDKQRSDGASKSPPFTPPPHIPGWLGPYTQAPRPAQIQTVALPGSVWMEVMCCRGGKGHGGGGFLRVVLVLGCAGCTGWRGVHFACPGRPENVPCPGLGVPGRTQLLPQRGEPWPGRGPGPIFQKG